MKLFLLSFILLISQIICYSQTISIKGSILNNNTSSPLPFVNIGIKDTYNGTTTNSNGEFSIKLPSNPKYRTLVFSCIGYESKEYTVPQGETNISIKLTPHTYDISEVTIMPDSTLRSFIRKAFDKIPENYPDFPTKYEGFYRASIQNEKDEYLRFMEVLTESYKSSYKNSIEGTVKVLKSRKYITKDSLTQFPIYFYGGIHFIHTADYVKQRASFLKGEKQFNYKLVATTKYNNDLIHIINFFPSKINTNRSKGTIYINAKSLAFVKIEKELTPEQLKSRFNPLHKNLTSLDKNITVNYLQEDSIYRISSIYENEHIKTSDNRIYSSPLEYIITSFNFTSPEKIHFNEQAPISYTPAVEAIPYSQSNWKDYSTLPLTSDLEIDSLKAKTILNTQDKNKDTREGFIEIMKKLNITMGIETSNISVSKANYSCNINNLQYENNTHKNQQISYFYDITYILNAYNYAAYKTNTQLSKNDFVIKNSIRYKRIIPIKTMGHQIIANLNAGWEWQKAGFSLGTTKSGNDFSFGGKKFKNEKIQAYSGLMMNGLTVGGGLDIQLSNLFHLSLSANYMHPSKTEDIIILQERSGFFLFRKTAHVIL